MPRGDCCTSGLGETSEDPDETLATWVFTGRVVVEIAAETQRAQPLRELPRSRRNGEGTTKKRTAGSGASGTHCLDDIGGKRVEPSHVGLGGEGASTRTILLLTNTLWAALGPPTSTTAYELGRIHTKVFLCSTVRGGSESQTRWLSGCPRSLQLDSCSSIRFTALSLST